MPGTSIRERHEAGRTVLLYAPRVARVATKWLVDEHPTLISAMGPLGVEMCERDLELHAQGIGEGLLLDRPEIFGDGVAVTARALSNVPTGRECIVLGLDALVYAMDIELPEPARSVSLEIARGGVELLDAPVRPDTYLDPSTELGEMSSDYLGAALRGDLSAARFVVRRAAEREGTPLGSLLTGVLQPAMYETGRMWQAAEIGVAEEHLVSHVTGTMIGSLRLEGVEAATIDRPRFLGVTPEGERHELGIAMVSTMLQAEGWDVRTVGAGAPLHSTIATVRTMQPDVLGISLTLGRHLPSVEGLIKMVRAERLPVRIMVGGQAAHAPGIDWAGIGADAVGVDALEAVATAQALLRQGRR